MPALFSNFPEERNQGQRAKRMQANPRLLHEGILAGPSALLLPAVGGAGVQASIALAADELVLHSVGYGSTRRPVFFNMHQLVKTNGMKCNSAFHAATSSKSVRRRVI
eukprot:1140791-Pelagomonas_calceolata.AAC.2